MISPYPQSKIHILVFFPDHQRMTKEELIEKLKQWKALTDYSLDGSFACDKFILSYNYPHWEFYYIDLRGGKELIKVFDSEMDSYDYICQFQLEQMERRKREKEEAIANADKEKHIHTIVTQVSGDGFVMTKTDKVYIPPEDMKKE